MVVLKKKFATAQTVNNKIVCNSQTFKNLSENGNYSGYNEQINNIMVEFQNVKRKKNQHFQKEKKTILLFFFSFDFFESSLTLNKNY